MKKGFTLVEVIVALAVAAILLGMIATSFYFMTKLSNKVLDESNNNYKIFIVKDYIIDNNITSDVSVNDGDVIINNKEIVFDSDITKIAFNDNKCVITYLKEDKECKIEFIIN